MVSLYRRRKGNANRLCRFGEDCTRSLVEGLRRFPICTQGLCDRPCNPSQCTYKQLIFLVRLCRGLSGRSATSIVAAYSRSFRLMRSRTQFAPLARVRSLTPAPLRARPFEGSLSLREKLFYLAFVSHFHPKGRRRFPKGDRKALGKQHKRKVTANPSSRVPRRGQGGDGQAPWNKHERKIWFILNVGYPKESCHLRHQYFHN